MQVSEIINDKSLKAKQKTEILGKCLVDNRIKMQDIIEFALTAKESAQATCIEALEFATRQNPDIANKQVLQFVSQTLTAKAPRVKWESAKVIANTAHLFTDILKDAIKNLLLNSEHEGTVVRWSAAFALAEILKLNTKYNKDLLPAIETIMNREEKNSIKKIYLHAIKIATQKV